jgi:hypothetical protein
MSPESSEDPKIVQVEEKAGASRNTTVNYDVLESVGASSIFSLPDTADYYFVVNVMGPKVTLSSSRFGIGQFNRSNYKKNVIKHQLKEVRNENQLILVGQFSSKASAKEYESNILPTMGNIMKVPAEKYNTFVITREGLEMLINVTMINKYLQFYKNSN